jgi:hypothetical protein
MKSLVLALIFAGMGLANTADVKYIGTNDGQFLFNVTYNNAGGNRFSVVILDESGNQLYQGVYSMKKFDKSFKFADPDGFKKLVFVIHNLGDNSVQRFEVNADSRLVEDVVVKEVR